MLKKSASSVLASLRLLNVPQRVRLGPSLAAALLDLFEHPAASFPHIPDLQIALKALASHAALITPISGRLPPEKIDIFLAQQAPPRHNAEEPQTPESYRTCHG